MEVHAHSHTPRKKWTHYFWEFLMLFLAVFCGFLAEYQLEHVIEHQREKEYITSLITDLEYDTLQFSNNIQEISDKIPYFDSIYLFFKSPASFNNRLPFAYWGKTDLMGSYIPAEPTIQQLKNSGNLRLLRNKKLLDSILIYDSHIMGSYMTQINYLSEFHKKLIESRQKVFDNISVSHFMDERLKGEINSKKNYDLIIYTSDKIKLKELYNAYIELKVSDVFYILRLKERKKEAIQLIKFIKKEYHLN